MLGRTCDSSDFHPPSLSIQEPASSKITEHAESTIKGITSSWPCLTQSHDKVEEIVKKLMILPQVTSCLRSARPIPSTSTGAFSASENVKVMLENVRGLILSSSNAVRFKIMKTLERKAKFGRASIDIEIFFVSKPSRLILSFMTWTQIL